MKDIQKLLTTRDKLFTDQTSTVITHLQPITAGVREFLTDVDPSYAGGSFVWQDIGMFDDDLLMLMGKVLYPLGYNLILDGHSTIIDEENQEFFSRALRIGIPINIVNLGESQPVVDFLEKLHHSTPVLEEPIELDSIEVPVKTSKPDVQLKPDVSSTHEFDLDALTDEQRASLRLFSRTIK